MFSYYLVLRYLVATGDPSDNAVKTEIVDLSDPTKSCLLLEDISWRYRGVGGLLGTTPVICGGFSGDFNGYYLNECLLYGTTQVITMNSKRYSSSSVTLNTSMLWIMGGYCDGRGCDGNNVFDSTELITTDGSVIGPTLPESVHSSCAVKFTETGNIYLIGGWTSSGTTNNVWVANPSNEFASFNLGPSMMTSTCLRIRQLR